MSVQLLDKTRKINKLLHNNNSSKVVFNDICAVTDGDSGFQCSRDQARRAKCWAAASAKAFR